MATFSIDITNIIFGYQGGYQDVTITNIPSGGLRTSITPEMLPPYFTVGAIENGVCRITANYNTGVGDNIATIRFEDVDDSNNYVDVEVRSRYYSSGGTGANMIGYYESTSDVDYYIYKYANQYGANRHYVYVNYEPDIDECIYVYSQRSGCSVSGLYSWLSYQYLGITTTGFYKYKLKCSVQNDPQVRYAIAYFGGVQGMASVEFIQNSCDQTPMLLMDNSGGTDTLWVSNNGGVPGGEGYTVMTDIPVVYGSSFDYSIERNFDDDTLTEYAYDVTFDANPSQETKYSLLRFGGEDDYYPLFTLVMQDPSAILSVSPSSLNFLAAGGTSTITVDYNGTLTEGTLPAWLSETHTVSAGRNVYTLTADTNTGSERSFVWTFSDDDATTSVLIYQRSPEWINVSPSGTLNVSGASGSLTFTVTKSEYAGDVTYNISDDWVTLVLIDNNRYVFNYTANPSTSERTASITFIGGGMTQVVNIQQYGQASLSLIPSSEFVYKNSGSVSFQVIAGGAITTVSYNIEGDWVTFDSVSGTVYTFNYTANTSLRQRQAFITFSGEGLSRVFTLTQDRDDTVLTISPLSGTVDGDSGTVQIEVTKPFESGEITYTISESWLTYSSVSGDIYTFSYEANPSTSERTATIVFSDGVSTETYTLTQLGVSLNISPESETINTVTAGSVEITVTVSGISLSDVSYSISDNWISYGSDVGGVYTFNYSANTSPSSRTATITFTGGGVSKVYTLTQVGPALSLSSTGDTVGYEGSYISVIVYKGAGLGNITAYIDKNWLSINNITEYGGGSSVRYGFYYTENTESRNREALVTFYAGDASVQYTLTQTAAPAVPYITLHPEAMRVDTNAGTFEIDVYVSNYSSSYAIQYDCSPWITFVSREQPSYYPSGNYLYKFSYTDNLSTDSRTGMIVFEYRNSRKVLNVIQPGVKEEASGFKVNPPVLRFYREGGRELITFDVRPYIGVSVDVNYFEGSDWLKVDGNFEGRVSTQPVVVEAEANVTSRKRTAEIVFTSFDLSQGSCTVKVIQGGDGVDSIWVDDVYYTEDLDENGNYYYSINPANLSEELYTGYAYGGLDGIVGIDVPRIAETFLDSPKIDEVPHYLGAHFNDHSLDLSNVEAKWTELEGSLVVDLVNKTSGQAGVVDKTYKLWADWSRFNKRYDYTRYLNDPINNKGCSGMMIPAGVYYDDPAVFSVDISYTGTIGKKKSTVVFDMLEESSKKFFIRYDTYYMVDRVDYWQNGDLKFSYDMTYCGEGALVYKNRFGGFDSFLIEGNIIKKDNYSKLNYSSSGSSYVADCGYYADEKMTDSNSINTTYEVHTGWLSDLEAEKLAYHLLSSPTVYFQNLKYDPYNTELLMFNPVRLTGSSAEYKKFKNGKRLVSYTITFEVCNTKKVRR